MKVAPFRALTHIIFCFDFFLLFKVEMKVAPFRALTQNNGKKFIEPFCCRNEGCPFQGIDTPPDFAYF